MGTDLIKLQDQFLEKFFVSRFGQDFYLTGGTALARFYFEHRESVDLDLFTNKQTTDFTKVSLLVHQIAKQLELELINEVNTAVFLQYNFAASSGLNLKIEVVKDIPVHFGKILVKDKVRVDSVENIGSNKILAVFGRTEAKDFVDLYYLMKIGKLDFEALYHMAGKKDLGLNYFYLALAIKGVEKLTVWPKMLEPLDKDELIKFYQRLRVKILRRIKPKVRL